MILQTQMELSYKNWRMMVKQNLGTSWIVLLTIITNLTVEKHQVDLFVMNTISITIKNQTPPTNETEGDRTKTFTPSDTIDIWTCSEILLGLKISGHTDTLTHASNLIDEIYHSGEIQNEQEHPNAPDKF